MDRTSEGILPGTAAGKGKTSISSWRLFIPMIPGLWNLTKVIIRHPGPALKMLIEAQGVKKRLRVKYRNTQLQYELPVFRKEMARVASGQVYLRSNRYMEVNAPEIIAMANELGAFRKSDREYGESCFNFVKRKVRFTFAARLRGAVETLKLGEAMCIDKTHLFIALCRAGGIPARFRLAQEAFSQNIYIHLTENDLIMRDWYNSLGYFILHAMAEALIDGEWVPADFSMDYRYEAALGLPLSRLGDEPEGTWNWALPGSTIRCEHLPFLFTFIFGLMLRMSTTILLSLQERMETEGLDLGRKALEEAGGEEAYDKKVRQTYRAVLPEVSKKLFKALQEVKE
jgi:hypothetical protein